MSLVIAIKDKDRIVLGADKQMSTSTNKSHASTKIWEVHDLSGAVMGSVGLARATQIIQYSDIIDKNFINETPTTEFIIKSLAPALLSALKSNGINCGTDDDPFIAMPNAFLFAYDDRAWMIWNDLSVTELEDYLAIGSGSDVARGALFATPDLDPFTRIVTSIKAASDSTLYVDSGLDILTTVDYKEDSEQIAAAVGIDLDALTVEEREALGLDPVIDKQKSTNTKSKKSKVKESKKK